MIELQSWLSGMKNLLSFLIFFINVIGASELLPKNTITYSVALKGDSGNYLYKGKGMVPNVQLSTNCGFGCFRIKTKYVFILPTAHFLVN
jgi:hypothetical protein